MPRRRLLGQPSEQNPESNNEAAAMLFPQDARKNSEIAQFINMNGAAR